MDQGWNKIQGGDSRHGEEVWTCGFARQMREQLNICINSKIDVAEMVVAQGVRKSGYFFLAGSSEEVYGLCHFA